MNKLGIGEVTEVDNKKRKPLEWSILCKDDESEETENINAHLPELSVLAELMGFKLESLDICPNLQNLKDEVKIEITCYKSGIQSVLKSGSVCNCPPKHVFEKAHFWQVIGLGPSIFHSGQTYTSTSSSSLWPKVSKTISRVITGLLKQILLLINSSEVGKNDAVTSKHCNNSVDIASKEPQPQTSTPDRHQSNVVNQKCAKCGILRTNLLQIMKIINESLDSVSLQELNKTFTRLSDVKETEGPSVKYLKELNGMKNTVKPSGTKGTIKTATTTGIARIIKTGKTIGTPTRLPKRKV